MWEQGASSIPPTPYEEPYPAPSISLPSSVFFFLQRLVFVLLESRSSLAFPPSLFPKLLQESSQVFSYCFYLRFTLDQTWRKNWQPTPVFLPGKSHGQGSLTGYSPRGRKESNTTERLTLSLWTRQISLKIASSPENKYQQVMPRVGSVCTRCLESDSSG